MAGRPVVGLAPPGKGPTGRAVVGLAGAQPAKKHDGGLLHLLKQTGVDLKNAALHAPGGVVAVAEAAAHDAYLNARHPSHDTSKDQLFPIAEGVGRQAVETVKHPGRHPGDTLLLGLPVAGKLAGAGERVAAAGAAAKEGEGAAAVVRAATRRPVVGLRTLKVGEMETRGHYSRNPGARVVQKAADKVLQAGAEKSVRVENVLHRRVAKWEQRNQRVGDAAARAPGTRLAALGRKLKPEELRALRLVAEETPVARRLGAQEMRKARATGKEVARHQERIDLTKGAMQFLDEHPTTGAPVFKPGEAKLRTVFDALKAATSDREGMLKQLDLMDEEALQAAKTKAGRVALGEPRNDGELPLSYEQAGIEHAPEPALRQRLSAIEGEYSKLVESAMGGKPGDYRAVTAIQNGRMKGAPPTVREQLLAGAETQIQDAMRAHPEHPAVQAWQTKLAEADKIRAELTRRSDVSVGLEEPRPLPAAPALFEASPDAVFVGNPVERSRLTGKPRVSSTGTFGHTRKPSSLKTSTGASVEHALERNDVTRIVAERHAEAVRLTKIERLVQSVKRAGEAAPRRKDDVFVWTDKLISNERIPKQVRRYLDNPDALARLNPDEQLSIGEQIKQAVLEQRDWRDPEQVAEFTKLAQQGKGVFVPRRLLGDAAKRDFNIGSVPGIAFVDAVNNAQKAGLVYLKLNYPVVQGLSNTAMGIIHQGFAYPVNLTRAVRLSHAIGPDLAAVVDDIMGQGAVMQAAFEGAGRVSHVSQKLARTMSHGVDMPARRAAFLHEAAKAGYGDASKLTQLLSDDSKLADLAEVAQRAKEAIVDYGDLSPFERGIVRRLVFVYPWQKGATKYAAHFLRDHPNQAAVAGLLAEQGKQRSDSVLGAVPSYLEGSIPFGDKLVNPAGVNFFQTPAQIGEAAAGLITGNPASPSLQDFLAPGPGIAVGLATRLDDIGRPLQGNVAANLRDLTVAQTPAAGLARAAAGGRDDALGELARKAFGSRRESKTFPDASDAYFKFLLGGLYPRRYSKPALNKNAAREKVGR